MKTVAVPLRTLDGGTHLQTLPPLALYVHIPWCVRKCPYCDFNSHEWRSATGESLPEDDYARALIADLESALPQVWGRRVGSVFFGGGTPSVFSAKSIDLLLSAFRARLALEADVEVTLEANPGTVEAGKFGDFRTAGVNRLSLGIQSFNPTHLRDLGRILAQMRYPELQRISLASPHGIIAFNDFDASGRGNAGRGLDQGGQAT